MLLEEPPPELRRRVRRHRRAVPVIVRPPLGRRRGVVERELRLAFGRAQLPEFLYQTLGDGVRDDNVILAVKGQIGTFLSSAGRAEPDGATGTHAANLRVDAANNAPPPPMLWPVT